ncbi:MAG: hypothetical protein F4Z29_07345, partial [Gemmatimonadetes bacterium]|nr:hypothetical protein [Gemmatimonadota bacterium]
MASLIKRMRNAAIYRAVRALIGLMNALPRQRALSVGGWIGRLAYLAARGPRRLALSNLTLAYGEAQSR